MTPPDPPPHRWAGLGGGTTVPTPTPPPPPPRAAPLPPPPPPPPPGAAAADPQAGPAWEFPAPEEHPEHVPPRAARRGALVALGALVVLVLVAGAFWWGRSGASTTTVAAATSAPTGTTSPSPSTTPDGSPTPGAPASSAPASASTAPSTPVPAPLAATTPPAGTDAEAAALAELERVRTASLATADLDGRWVAQVVSKSVGTVDPLQTAANGTHTFRASDILDQVTSVDARVDGQLYLLTGTDFGPRSTAPDGHPWWNAVTQQGFASSDAVLAWCASQFPELAGEPLHDACVPRTLDPPS